MALPSRVRIHGLWYPVVSVVGKKDRHLSKHGRAWGCLVNRTRTIKIDKRAPLEMQQETLLHEIVHGIVSASGLDDVITEKRVLLLARSLYGVLMDNPELARWLIGQDE